ncbi:hypothetical protein FF1_042418 [Malus domestica]
MHEAPKNAMEMATEWVSQSTESSRVRIGAEVSVIKFLDLKRAAEEKDDGKSEITELGLVFSCKFCDLLIN